jgi:hypothetical protein
MVTLSPNGMEAFYNLSALHRLLKVESVVDRRVRGAPFRNPVGTQ